MTAATYGKLTLRRSFFVFLPEANSANVISTRSIFNRQTGREMKDTAENTSDDLTCVYFSRFLDAYLVYHVYTLKIRKGVF